MDKKSVIWLDRKTGKYGVISTEQMFAAEQKLTKLLNENKFLTHLDILKELTKDLPEEEKEEFLMAHEPGHERGWLRTAEYRASDDDIFSFYITTGITNHGETYIEIKW